jgi:hypothetical protein
MNHRNRLRFAVAAAIGAAAMLPLAAQAHRAWMLPSSTVVSGNNAWVTVDAASSNDLFYFDHNPMRLDNLKVFAPDGKVGEAKNLATGKYRSTFDVQLNQPGTWRISMLNDNVQASYKVGTETKRARGNMETVRKEIPAGATDVSVSRNQTRIDVFVTSGKPTDAVLKPTGSGLELVGEFRPRDGWQACSRCARHRDSRRHPLSRPARRDQDRHRQGRQVLRHLARGRHVLDECQLPGARRG